MLDAGDHPVAVGERVTLFGRGGPDGEALAATIGTISYELLTGISPGSRGCISEAESPSGARIPSVR